MTVAGRSDRAGAVLELRVLGTFAVRYQGRPLALPPSRKTRALLAYLAVADQPQGRERLCGLFWDAPDDLRAALRWSLSKLRKIVNVDGQEVLTADRGQVTLRTQSIDLDWRQMHALSLRLPSADIAELEQAAHALKSGFLEDLSLARCREFESWRLSHANQAHLLRATILRTLVDRLAAEPSRALTHALALQAIDPANSSLTAEVKAVAESARELAVTAPKAEGQGARRPAPRAVAATPPIAEGTREDATMLAIGIVSPLHGFASVAPDLVLRQLDPLFELAHRLIERHGGIVTASGSTGITALFGSAACDNHAAVACRAALAVKSITESESAGSVRVRAGLDSGEVIVRYRRHGTTERIEVAGAAVRTAERLVHSLRRGVLALTDRTQLVAAGLVDTSLLPRSELARFGRDGQVYQLLGEAGQKLG
jgi:DNA-binding SARP family transcriptional activator